MFVVDKQGKVLASQPGGPEATVGVVQALVEGGLAAGGAGEAEEVKENGDGAAEKVEEEVKEANGDGKKSEEAAEEEPKGEAAE